MPDPKLQGLNPVVAAQAVAFLAMSKIPIKITQGLRTFQEQDELYAQGRTKPGAIVTNAKGGWSNHNYGLAFDIAGADGSYNLPWEELGKLGESLGLEWGGRWTGFADRPHFQWTGGKTIQQLLRGEQPEGATLMTGFVWARQKGIFSQYTEPSPEMQRHGVFFQRFYDLNH